MMKSRVKRGWCFLLAAALLLALSDGMFHTVSADDMTVTRELPDTVVAGQTFDVIITFTASANNFHAIVLFDEAPTSWTVEVDKTWCTPEALSAKIYQDNEAEYTWLGPYAEGTEFTALYKVTVPDDAVEGTHTFPDGYLLFYIEPYPAPANQEPITGNYEVEVDEKLVMPPAGGAGHPVWTVLLAGLMAGASLLVLSRRRRKSQA